MLLPTTSLVAQLLYEFRCCKHSGADTADGKHFMASLGLVQSATITRVVLVLKAKSVELADPRAEMDATTNMRKPAGQNKETSIELHYVSATEGNAISTDDRGYWQTRSPFYHKS